MVMVFILTRNTILQLSLKNIFLEKNHRFPLILLMEVEDTILSKN